MGGYLASARDLYGNFRTLTRSGGDAGDCSVEPSVDEFLERIGDESRLVGTLSHHDLT